MELQFRQCGSCWESFILVRKHMNTSQFQSFLGLSEEICAGASISTPSSFSENDSDHSAKSRKVLHPSFFSLQFMGGRRQLLDLRMCLARFEMWKTNWFLNITTNSCNESHVS